MQTSKINKLYLLCTLSTKILLNELLAFYYKTLKHQKLSLSFLQGKISKSIKIEETLPQSSKIIIIKQPTLSQNTQIRQLTPSDNQ